ncbi:MAG: TonB-dependent receptor, partial [Bacteroidales bacterium]|nr:TonB-dependent receptor [Bacteroidales bacterium]
VLEIEMEEKVLDIDEVVIKAYDRKDETINEMAMISARSFTIEETERYAGSLGDPARMVANYAGVMTQNDSRNDIIIRGNSPMGVLWRLDGIEIPNPNHFNAVGTTGGPVSMINNNLLTNSDFLTGAFPAEFGNAYSGVFDLNMRTGNNEKREYVGQAGFGGVELGAEGPINREKKSSYLINYRYSVLAFMHYLGFGTETGSAVPFYQDLSFKFDFPKTKVGRISLFGLGGKSNIKLLADTTDEEGNAYNTSFSNTYYIADMGVIGLSHLIFLNEKTRIKSTVSVYGTTNSTEFDKVYYVKDNSTVKDSIVDFYRSKYFDGKISFSSTLKSKINASNNYNIGIIYDYFMGSYDDSVFIDEDNKYRILTEGEGKLPLVRLFGQWQHKFSDEITLYTGLYSQYFKYTENYVIEPRLGLNWQFKSNQSINIGYGKHSMIQPRQTYFSLAQNDINDDYDLSNKNLGFTKSDHYVIGYNYLINKDLRLKAEAYYQDLYNIPISKNEPTFSMINQGDFFGIWSPDSMINEGTGYNYGVELTFEKFLSKGYYFLLTGSIFDSKYRGYDNVLRNTAFNGNYIVNLLGGYEKKVGKKNNRMTYDVKLVWAGGKRYVPYTQELHDLIALGEDIPENMKITSDDIEDYLDYDKAYKVKYNDYIRFDLRIGYKVNKERYNQEWALDLQNISGLFYECVFSEEYDPERNKILVTPQQGFYPMVLWRIQF